MLSLRDHFPDAQVIELGGELIDSNHVRIRALAAELDLPLDDLLQGETAADTWYFDGRSIGDGQPGPMVARLQALYRELAQRDLASRAGRRPS